jgi:hypothetical protein
VYDSVIWAHAVLGRFDKAEEAHTQAVTLLGEDPTAGIDLWGMSSLLSVTHVWIYVLAWTGRLGEAERELRHACEVAKQHQQLDMLCWMETATVYLARLGGNIVRPLEHARTAIELAEKVGNALRRGASGRCVVSGSRFSPNADQGQEVGDGEVDRVSARLKVAGRELPVELRNACAPGRPTGIRCEQQHRLWLRGTGLSSTVVRIHAAGL